MSASSREAIMYQASYFGSHTPSAISAMAETIISPEFRPEDLQAVRDSAYYETREMEGKPELSLPEILHRVAYGNAGLGNPLLCPTSRIDSIHNNDLRAFMNEWFQPHRVVIAGAGIPHEELVELARKHFGSMQSTPQAAISPQCQRANTSIPIHLLQNTPPTHNFKSLARSASFLTTAQISDHDESPYSGGHFFKFAPDSPQTHVYIAFEGLPIDDPDIYTLATLQFILGGGGSFSAGGPGKGMYSRLYTHVLNHHPEVDHCAAFHHIYTDSSLFGLFASFFPPNSSLSTRGATSKQILPHLVHQFSLLLHTPIPAQELTRAKNQLKSSLVMALESRAVEVEDLGRQILVHGRKIPAIEMCDRIDEVTADDVRRVSHRIFGDACRRPPAVVVQGADDLVDSHRTFRKYGVGGPGAN